MGKELILQKPKNGWSIFKMEGMEHEYCLSDLTDIPLEWLDQCINGLKYMRPFTVQGYLEPGRMICTVSVYNCCIYVEDELERVTEVCGKTVTQLPVGMLTFSRMLCEAIEANYQAWANWITTHMTDVRIEELRNRVSLLKELIEEQRSHFDEPEIDISNIDDLELFKTELEKEENREDFLILSKPKHGWTTFRPEKDALGCDLSDLTNVPMDWIDRAIEGLISGAPFCVDGELEPGMMVFVVTPAASYQIVEAGFSDVNSIDATFRKMGMLRFCKELHKALMANIDEWETWGFYEHDNGRPGEETLREKLKRLQCLIEGIERRKRGREIREAEWKEAQRRYEEEKKSRPKPEVTEKYRAMRTEVLTKRNRIKNGEVIVPLLEGKAAPLDRYLSIEQMTLDDLVLTVRSYNCLKRADKTTLRKIMAMSKKELSSVRNLGKKSFDEVIAIVNELLFEGGENV